MSPRRTSSLTVPFYADAGGKAARLFLVGGLALTACTGSDRGQGSEATPGGPALDDAEAAERFLSFLAEARGTTLHDGEPCPMENPQGEAFYHVLQSDFPSHVFASSVLEFDVLSSFGTGVAGVGSVVTCVEGASGYLEIEETSVENMPMMEDPIELSAKGQSSEDAGLVGGSVVVSTGVINTAGQAGAYASTVTQVCAEDGDGCQQACADPIAPTSAMVFDGGDMAVCDEANVLDEDGAFASLGRTSGSVATLDGIPVSQACVAVDFPATAANTVRVVGSWTRDGQCGGAVCGGAECGAGHAYGVWSSGDGGTTLTHLGMAQGTQTTTAPATAPAEPQPPLAGEHFLAAGLVDTVVVCRLAFSADADQVALDYVELCPG